MEETVFDAPAADDTAPGADEATGTTETILADVEADEVPSCEEIGIGTTGDALFAGEIDALELASATGQTVVYKAIVEVKTWVDRAGQLVTVAAQDVTVTSFVV